MGVKAVSCEKKTHLGCFVSSWLELNRHLRVVTHKNQWCFASFEYVEEQIRVKFVVNNDKFVFVP